MIVNNRVSYKGKVYVRTYALHNDTHHIIKITDEKTGEIVPMDSPIAEVLMETPMDIFCSESACWQELSEQ